MVPVNPSSHFPFRPKFLSDISSVHWIDNIGTQKKYVNSDDLWSKFVDMLPVFNSSKIMEKSRGIVLKSQLFGRAWQLCQGIDEKTICPKNSVKATVDCKWKTDGLSITCAAFRDLTALLSTKQGMNEAFLSFKARFTARFEQLNSNKPAFLSVKPFVLESSIITLCSNHYKDPLYSPVLLHLIRALQGCLSMSCKMNKAFYFV